MALLPFSSGGRDVLRRIPQNAISGHMYVKLNTNPILNCRASTTGGTVSIPVVMRSPEPVPTSGQHFPLDSQPGRLPLLHESFPGKSRFGGTGRSFTMFPLTRRKTEDVEEEKMETNQNNGPAKLKLPELELDLPQHELPRLSLRCTHELSSKYVDAYKSRLRRKGLDVKEVYSFNRNKLNKDRKQNTEIRRKDTDRPEQIGPWKFGGMPLNEYSVRTMEKKTNHGRKLRINKKKNKQPQGYDMYKTTNINQQQETSKSSLSAQETEYSETTESQLEKDFKEFIEDFTDSQGMKRKTHNYGRKLGNIVSPLRMSQLLEVENPIKMENFYNHYL